MRRFNLFVLVVASFAAVVACSGGSGGTESPQTAVTCSPPSPVPTPVAAWMGYPANGATRVPTSIGRLIEEGADEPPTFALSIVISANGTPVPIGTPTVAASPFPTPFSTAPPNYPVLGPFVAIPLPALSPNTTYNVAQSYAGWSNTPPQCTATITQPVGSFSTGN